MLFLLLLNATGRSGERREQAPWVGDGLIFDGETFAKKHMAVKKKKLKNHLRSPQCELANQSTSRMSD